jgi:hypothetical protein
VRFSSSRLETSRLLSPLRARHRLFGTSMVASFPSRGAFHHTDLLLHLRLKDRQSLASCGLAAGVDPEYRSPGSVAGARGSGGSHTRRRSAKSRSDPLPAPPWPQGSGHTLRRPPPLGDHGHGAARLEGDAGGTKAVHPLDRDPLKLDPIQVVSADPPQVLHCRCVPASGDSRRTGSRRSESPERFPPPLPAPRRRGPPRSPRTDGGACHVR